MDGRTPHRIGPYTVLDELTARALMDTARADSIDVIPIAGNPSLPVAAIYPMQRGLTNPASIFIDCMQGVYQALQQEVAG